MTSMNTVEYTLPSIKSTLF